MERPEAMEEPLAQPAAGAMDEPLVQPEEEAMDEPLVQSAQGPEAPGTQGGQRPQGPEAPGTQGGQRPPYVYVLCRLEPTFPSRDIEREFVQATGRAAEELTGLTDREALQRVLSDRANRYLWRQLCWVARVGGIATYIVVPQYPEDYELLIESLRPAPRPTDVDLVIGARGPIPPPEACNGLMVPVVFFEQTYSFDVESLTQSLERPADVAEERWETIAEELFYRVSQVAENAGATDEDRARNFSVVRSQAIYNKGAEMFAQNYRLSGVEVRPSGLSSGTQRVMDVVFSFTNRDTNVTEKWFERVDVSGMFPNLVTPLSPLTEPYPW
jgi:hypothetical protein